MTYRIYGTPQNLEEKVCYGTAVTLELATAEMHRMRKAGVSHVYAIGFDPDVANAMSKRASERVG